jgi:hypothetical protein
LALQLVESLHLAATKYYPTHARSLDQNIVKPASTDRSYGDLVSNR